MRVHASHLNSINIRDASQPYSTCHEGHRYIRRYLAGDTLRVQLVGDEGVGGGIGFTAHLLDFAGVPVQGGVTKKYSYKSGLDVFDIIISGVPVGEYSLRVHIYESEQHVALQSEPFEVVEELHEKSVLLEYANSESYFGAFFDTVRRLRKMFLTW